MIGGLLEVAGADHDRAALFSGRDELAVQVGLGSHVHALGRLVEQEHGLAPGEPLAEQDLLLVSAAEDRQRPCGVQIPNTAMNTAQRYRPLWRSGPVWRRNPSVRRVCARMVSATRATARSLWHRRRGESALHPFRR
jgi:hypothetical protein